MRIVYSTAGLDLFGFWKESTVEYRAYSSVGIVQNGNNPYSGFPVYANG